MGRDECAAGAPFLRRSRRSLRPISLLRLVLFVITTQTFVPDDDGVTPRATCDSYCAICNALFRPASGVGRQPALQTFVRQR